ncbi:uncharacterized protein [Montipora foliosa]|uniref:uncharacterized protein isoform X1 n=1 Tax=Montipora foliosa TaxID=591990 RepID=UPI0035F20E4A
MEWFNRFIWNFQKPPYVVLLGDVGTGKSTILEKLTEEKGRSSDAKESFTRTYEVLWVPDGSLIVADTPGSNSLKDKGDQNLEIARALNFRPVSRIFIVVKAETRIGAVVDNARKYADRFLELPMDVVGVLVTHMDLVDWTDKDFTPRIKDELGIDSVVFSWITTNRETLKKNILKTCNGQYNLTVNDENFLKLFKIQSNHRKILKSTSDEVKRFSEKKKAFDEARRAFNGKDLVDLVFEFQAYMTDEIVEARKRMSKINNFTFEGDGAANEAGHVANMVNQLRMVLYDIRTECLGYQSEHGVSELRKCPHCGLIWTKVQGCEGDTTCGNRPYNVNDFRDPAYAQLGTFLFRWFDGRLRITKVSHKTVKSERSSKPKFGCGKSINWKQMATVEVPSEFSESVKVATSDIRTLPPAAANFREELSGKIDGATRKMKLPERPSQHKTEKSGRQVHNSLGCGKSINWKQMATVTVPPEFSEAVKVATSDIRTLPPAAANFREELSGKIDAATRKMKLPERPSQHKTEKSDRQVHNSLGCGKSINWKQMTTVEVPSEFSEAVKVAKSDIRTMRPALANFRGKLSEKIDAAGRTTKLPERPSQHKTEKSDRQFHNSLGCGKSINWKQIATVTVPPEFSETVKAGASDDKTMRPALANFRGKLSEKIDAAGRTTKLPKRPSKF